MQAEQLINLDPNQSVNVVKMVQLETELAGMQVKLDSVDQRLHNFKDKAEIKKLGGKWDFRKKCWYVEFDDPVSLEKFSKWIPTSCLYV